MSPISKFKETWFVDFEFRAQDGNRPEALCMVALELRSGKLIRKWLQGGSVTEPPIQFTSETLFIAYFASAEFNCFLNLGWSLPPNVIDLYVEFRNQTNGLTKQSGLLSALQYFGLPSIGAVEKEEMRNLALRGGDYTATEREALLNYCESDVRALFSLLPKLSPRLNLGQALHRGRYMKAVATMEHNGIPIDPELHRKLIQNRTEIILRLVQELDPESKFFEGVTFKINKLENYVRNHNLNWPKTNSGRFALDEDTFRSMSIRYPELAPIRDLRETMGQLRKNSLAVGPDGRNRCLLSPFASKTSRNQPSTSKFIFGQPAWLRSLIRPEKGRAISYIDYSQTDIDMQRGTAFIRSTYIRKERVFRDYPKGKRQHSKPIPKELVEELKAAKVTAKNDFVVTSPEYNMLSYEGYNRRLHRYCNELGIRRIGTHGIRHSTAELYQAFGATRDDIQTLFAHSCASVSERYMHGRGNTLDKVSNVVELFPNGDCSKFVPIPNGNNESTSQEVN